MGGAQSFSRDALGMGGRDAGGSVGDGSFMRLLFWRIVVGFLAYEFADDFSGYLADPRFVALAILSVGMVGRRCVGRGRRLGCPGDGRRGGGVQPLAARFGFGPFRWDLSGVSLWGTVRVDVSWKAEKERDGLGN